MAPDYKYLADILDDSRKQEVVLNPYVQAAKAMPDEIDTSGDKWWEAALKGLAVGATKGFLTNYGIQEAQKDWTDRYSVGVNAFPLAGPDERQRLMSEGLVPSGFGETYNTISAQDRQLLQNRQEIQDAISPYAAEMIAQQLPPEMGITAEGLAGHSQKDLAQILRARSSANSSQRLANTEAKLHPEFFLTSPAGKKVHYKTSKAVPDAAERNDLSEYFTAAERAVAYTKELKEIYKRAKKSGGEWVLSGRDSALAQKISGKLFATGRIMQKTGTRLEGPELRNVYSGMVVDFWTDPVRFLMERATTGDVTNKLDAVLDATIHDIEVTRDMYGMHPVAGFGVEGGSSSSYGASVPTSAITRPQPKDFIITDPKTGGREADIEGYRNALINWKKNR